MTHLNHVKSGPTKLARDVFSLNEVEKILKNPRGHTGRGRHVADPPPTPTVLAQPPVPAPAPQTVAPPLLQLPPPIRDEIYPYGEGLVAARQQGFPMFPPQPPDWTQYPPYLSPAPHPPTHIFPVISTPCNQSYLYTQQPGAGQWIVQHTNIVL